MAREVTIRLAVDADSAIRGIRGADGALVELGRSSTKAGGSLGKLGGFIKGLIAVETIRRVAAYGARLFELGTAAEETASKFRTVFGPAAQAVDDALREFANTAGLTQSEARGLGATFGSVAQGMGETREASADLSVQALQLAADFASFNNVPIEQSVQAVTSAVVGEREALKSLGVVLTEAEVKAAEASAEFAGMSRAAVTLELISQKAGVAVGDLARTQDSTANSTRRLGAELREQEERFAQLNKVTFDYVLGAAEELIRQNREGGRSFAERLARGILIAVGAMTKGVTGAVNLGRAVLRLNRAVGDVVGADGGFSLFALGVNSALGLLAAFEKRTLQVAIGVRRMERAWADFRGDPKRVGELSAEIEDLEKGVADAEAAMNRFGRTFRGGLFVPNASFGFMADSLADFEEAVAGLGDLGSASASVQELGTGLDQVAQSGDDAEDRMKKLAEAVSKAVRVFNRAGGALQGTGFGPESQLRDLQLRQQEAREGARAAASEAVALIRDVQGVAVEAGGSAQAVAIATARVYGEQMLAAADALSGVFAQAGQDSQTFYALYQGIASSQAAIDAFAAANSAYRSLAGIPVVGPALGAAAAAAALAAGFVNVRSILSESPGGASTGGGSASFGGGSRSSGGGRGSSSYGAGIVVGGSGAPRGGGSGYAPPASGGAGSSPVRVRSEVVLVADGKRLAEVVTEAEGRRQRLRGGGSSL